MQIITAANSLSSNIKNIGFENELKELQLL